MVKAPKTHGLDRKYKPWRKGKSEKAKSKRGSLKQQLRGQERLLARAADDQHRQTIEEKIAELMSMIEEKHKAETERDNARKSHRKRFLERQRLTRMERNTRKNPNLSEEARERELKKIALDMVYVAHYPLDVRYLDLFRGSSRVVDVRRQLVKRAITRQRVLQKFKQDPSHERVKWISQEQYNRLPAHWSVEDERETFGEAKPASRKKDEIQDDRFAMDAKHSTLLEVAEQIDSTLDQEVGKIDRKEKAKGSDSDSSDGEEQEEADLDDKRKKVEGETDSDSTSSSKDDTSSSGESEQADPLTEKSRPSPAVVAREVDDSDSSSDDDSSSSSSGSSDEEEVANEEVRECKESIADDDFLVADDTIDEHEVFAKARRHIPAMDEAMGDKSKGWATQRQRPGQFKKRRLRR